MRFHLLNGRWVCYLTSILTKKISTIKAITEPSSGYWLRKIDPIVRKVGLDLLRGKKLLVPTSAVESPKMKIARTLCACAKPRANILTHIRTRNPYCFLHDKSTVRKNNVIYASKKLYFEIPFEIVVFVCKGCIKWHRKVANLGGIFRVKTQLDYKNNVSFGLIGMVFFNPSTVVEETLVDI